TTTSGFSGSESKVPAELPGQQPTRTAAGAELTGRVIAVMPAYNAARTLKRTLDDIPEGVVDEIVLVDDHSTDNTVELARSLGLTVIVHEDNRGYGGNQKTCYRRALDAGAEFVVMIHPDYQYDARVIGGAIGSLRLGIREGVPGWGVRTRREALEGGVAGGGYVVMIHPDYQYDARVIGVAIEILRLGICDVILGSRIRTRREALEGGMPGWKYVANRILTTSENVALGQNLGDFHSGFRAYRR